MGKYSCPMHLDVVSSKAGKCPKCGMSLTRPKKENMTLDVVKTYACPMHVEVTSEKPGKCPRAK
ncbi:MAG: heavy metal-binding domain-containing protein [Ferruginibacter sp.]